MSSETSAGASVQGQGIIRIKSFNASERAFSRVGVFFNSQILRLTIAVYVVNSFYYYLLQNTREEMTKLFTALACLSLPVMQADGAAYDPVPGYKFTTTNGFGAWGEDPADSEPGTTGINKSGNITWVEFAINSDSLYATKPSGTVGSLTEVTDVGGAAVSFEDSLKYFEPVDKVKLTEITLVGHSTLQSNFPTGTTMTIIDSLGNSYTSNEVSFTASVNVQDPWGPSSWYYPRSTGQFVFDGDILLDINEVYRVTFNQAVALTLTENGDEGFGLSNYSQYAPAAMKIVTWAVPEPTTSSLSLLALAGLMLRRRRLA